MKIQVTQDDIENGLPNTNLFCPIARALTRQITEHSFHVERKFVIVDKLQGGPVKDLPRSAREFIKRFDNNMPVKPFNFILNI